MSLLCAVSANVPLAHSPKGAIYCPSRQKKAEQKGQLIVPFIKRFSTNTPYIVPFRSSAVFAPNAYTTASNSFFSQRLSFSIREPGINGTYPGNACGMVLLLQSIIVYGEQLNERMCENNEQNLSNAEIIHNKSIQDRRRDKKQK